MRSSSFDFRRSGYLPEERPGIVRRYEVQVFYSMRIKSL